MDAGASATVTLAYHRVCHKIAGSDARKTAPQTAERFGITEHDLETYLSEALSAGGDYADVSFEYLATRSLGIDEQIGKSATEGVSMGISNQPQSDFLLKAAP